MDLLWYYGCRRGVEKKLAPRWAALTQDVVHWAYGLAWGALFGIVAGARFSLRILERGWSEKAGAFTRPSIPIVWGLGVWAVAHLMVLPFVDPVMAHLFPMLPTEHGGKTPSRWTTL